LLCLSIRTVGPNAQVLRIQQMQRRLLGIAQQMNFPLVQNPLGMP